jgi:hypothetical protein
MSSKLLSSPVLATPRSPALAFQWLFTVCAVFTPMLLIVYAFAISPDAMERAQIIVQGLESTVLSLVASLIMRALYVFGIKSDSTHLVTKSDAVDEIAPA